MTGPSTALPWKVPVLSKLLPSVPPAARSREAMAFTLAAAEGQFRLQRCAACGHVCHPAREACPRCWSADLPWTEMPEGGTLLADSTLRASFNPWFKKHLPWRIGTVQLDAGPVVLAHLHGGVLPHARVRIVARTDKSGQGVLMALPDTDTPDLSDDRQWHSLTCDPKNRRVLITAGHAASGQNIVGAMTQALADAGAKEIFVGLPGGASVQSGTEYLKDITGVKIVPLDLADSASITKLAQDLGGQTDIVIHTSGRFRPTAEPSISKIAATHEDMEAQYVGLQRLVQAFGAVMRLRVAHGDESPCAWVNIMSLHSLADVPAHGSASTGHVDASTLNQCLQSELGGSGIKVVTAVTGPLDDEWHQALPPPKVSPAQLASAVVEGLRQGLERITVEPVTGRDGEQHGSRS